MPVHLEWYDVVVRLVLTVIAGSLVGINRTERGRPAGLRTTILVCLAASVAMIQANLLMPTNGKPDDSYIHLDLMRLPLGILTGIGFIGAGAIIRKGDIVHGVTTAATLWLVTVMGLCFGGGQLGLGAATTIIALFVLWVLRGFEVGMRRDRHATLTLSLADAGPSPEDVRALLTDGGFQVGTWDVFYRKRGDDRRCTLQCEVHWIGQQEETQMPAILKGLRDQPGVLALRWHA